MVGKGFCLIILLVASVFPTAAQPAQLIKLKELQSLIDAPGETKVINFWATWCAPCVKELPLFEKLNHDRKDVKVMLVSMDIDLDPNPEKVRKFVARKNMNAPVYILDEQHPDSWISKIEKTWSGALPATLIIGKDGKRIFIEKELHEGELEKLVDGLQ